MQQNPKPIIFVSSTVENLPNERAVAKKVIEDLNCIPSMSEYNFNSESNNPIDVCIRKVKESDIYILLLGPSYGFELESGISITEAEFDTALKEGKPILVFNLSYTKDVKQLLFEKKVGSLITFTKSKNSYELEKNIKDSIEKLFRDRNVKKSLETETITTNLVEVSFPDSMFIAELAIDRKKVIRLSKNGNRPLLKNASNAAVAKEALWQKGIKVGSDFIIRENKIYTFYDLRDVNNRMRPIIDIGTIERIDSRHFYLTDEDSENIFKDLLHRCFVRVAYSIRVSWDYENKLFFFLPENEGDKVRIMSWRRLKNAKRKVFEIKYKNNKPEEILQKKHLAFRTRFFFFNEKCYLKITPDWFITWLDYKKSRFSKRAVTYLKKMERNYQVLNHFEFIVYSLKHPKPSDLFNEVASYKMLKLGGALRFESYPKVEDSLWFSQESKIEKKNLSQTDEIFEEVLI